MNETKPSGKKLYGITYVIVRLAVLLNFALMFFPSFNLAYVFSSVNGTPIKNSTSLFTIAVNRSSLFSSAVRGAIDKDIISGGELNKVYIACLIMLLATIVLGVGGCMSVGNFRFKRLANFLLIGGGLLLMVGPFMIMDFNNHPERAIHNVEKEQTDEKVFSGKFELMPKKDVMLTVLPSEFSKAENAYRLTIHNGSGGNLTGWAVELVVGEEFTEDDIEFIGKYYKKGTKNTDEVKYSAELVDGMYVIMPEHYSLEDGQLVLEDGVDSSSITDASLQAGSDITLVVIANNIPDDLEVIVTDGTADLSAIANNTNGLCMFYIILGAFIALIGLLSLLIVPKPELRSRYEIESKYQLFLMYMPFLILIFAFSYLPLYGWRFAFMKDANQGLTSENFAGMYWFNQLFGTKEFRDRFFRVMRNTLAMSGLGLLTSWLPMAFAIFLNEVKSTKFRRFVQTFSTIPNFISWVLVYAIAFAIFASDGMLNNLFGGSTDHLANNSHLWLKMLAWGTWKGIGWSAIIYISGIAGIDQQLYEAASIDGADRFQRMWNITLPGLLPTYVVMLVMSIAGILSNGMDQYLVFTNANTSEPLEVLDLYVYNLGISGNQIPLSTVIGMGKSVISIVLFFIANTAAKKIRGNGIV